MEAVPREAFLDPGLSTKEVYANEPVLLKRGADGRVISTMSQPSMIVAMLDQLEVEQGDRVLEIGTASGYNAALLAHLTGPAGLVVSVELEVDLAAQARRALEAAGVDQVRVVCADGRAGWPADSPYDRIIVTAAADRVEPAWVDQLRDGGRIVVPMARDEMCFAYEKRNGALVEQSKVPARFVPLRSARPARS